MNGTFRGPLCDTKPNNATDLAGVIPPKLLVQLFVSSLTDILTGAFPPDFCTINSMGNLMILTPPKTNMEPENHPLEKENHLPSTSIFWLHVSF